MKKIIKIPLLAFVLLTSTAYSQQLVRASGNLQMVTTAGTKIIMNGGITFLNTSSLKTTGDSIYLYNYSAGVPGNWLDSTTAGALDITGTGKVFFNGSVRQSFYGKTRFYDLYIRNTIGDTLLSSCEVRDSLHLDTGYVYTRTGWANDSLLLSNPAVGAIVSTSNFTKSWVSGRLSRVGNSTPTAYLFPIGKTDSLYAPVKLLKFNTNTTTWTGEYFPATPFDNTNVFYPPIDHISKVEYWEVYSNTVTGNDDDAKVSLSWRGYSRVSATAGIRDSLVVAQYINNPPFKWNVPGGWFPGLAIGPDSLSGYVTSNTYNGAFDTSQRRFALGTYSKFNALPLQLLYFTAIADGNKVRLNWDVDNEQNVSLYEVEKSLTGTGFTHLSTVTSLQRAQALYTDYDYTPATGWNYYRIKIIDKSGAFTYSPVRAVKFDKGLEEIKIFPNPTTDILNIQLPSSYISKVDLRVYSIDGKFISSLKPTVNTVQLNVLPLPAGTYILRITRNDGTINNYRFVKQ